MGRVTDMERRCASEGDGASAVRGARPVQVRGSDDQPDVAEGLRCVAQQLAGGGVDLLGEQADVVGVADELVEQSLGAVEVGREGVGF